MRIICRVYVLLTGYTDMPIEGVCIYATIRNPDTRAAWLMWFCCCRVLLQEI